MYPCAWRAHLLVVCGAGGSWGNALPVRASNQHHTQRLDRRQQVQHLLNSGVGQHLVCPAEGVCACVGLVGVTRPRRVMHLCSQSMGTMQHVSVCLEGGSSRPVHMAVAVHAYELQDMPIGHAGPHSNSHVSAAPVI